MTPDKLYQLTCEMLHQYDGATGSNGADQVINHPDQFVRGIFPFYANAAEILIDCKTRLDKQTTPAAALSAIKRIFKSAMASGNQALHGIIQEDGYDCICDGHRIIRLSDRITSLPVLSEKVVPPHIGNLMAAALEQNQEEIPLPEFADLKAYVARCKAAAGNSHHYSFQLLPYHVYVNPAYLLDMIQALPGCKAYINSDVTKAGKSMIYFKAENGDGVLLPVNPNTAAVL